VWTLAGGARLAQLRLGAPLTALALDAADGALLAGAADGRVFLAPLAGGAAAELCGHTRAVRALAASADGRLALSASDDGSLRVWCLATRQALRSVAHARGGAAPAAALLLLPRAALAAGAEAAAPPPAPLAKYAGGWGAGAKPWEGPPVLLRAPAPAQPPARAHDGGAEGELDALRARLAEATAEAARWCARRLRRARLTPAGGRCTASCAHWWQSSSRAHAGTPQTRKHQTLHSIAESYWSSGRARQSSRPLLCSARSAAPPPSCRGPARSGAAARPAPRRRAPPPRATLPAAAAPAQ